MIPTMLLFGFIFGRWWKSALLVGTVGWVLLLWSDPGTRNFDPEFVLTAGALGLANTAVGVLVHQLLRAVVVMVGRWLRGRDTSFEA